MQVKIIVVFTILFLITTLNILAQTPQNETNPQDFGWSLKPVAKKKINKNKTITDDDTIKVETNLVINDIFVLNKNGYAITGLKAKDFIVIEDEIPQKLEIFSLGNDVKLPRSIVLIIDIDAGMYPFRKTNIGAAKTLIDKLNPLDKIAIVTDNVELLTGFTSDKELLKQKLGLLESRIEKKDFGVDGEYSALLASLNELFDAHTPRPIVIFQTDGTERVELKDFFSSEYFNKLQKTHKELIKILKPREEKFKLPNELITKNFSFDDVVTAIEKSGATIYSIIPFVQLIGYSEREQFKRFEIVSKEYQKIIREMYYLPELTEKSEYYDKIISFYTKMHLSNHTALTQLATFTGGWADYLETPEKADEIYTRILNDMNSRYIIGYYPTNEKRDGKRRNIKIEVRNHPEYIVWGRKTYFAPEE